MTTGGEQLGRPVGPFRYQEVEYSAEVVRRVVEPFMATVRRRAQRADSYEAVLNEVAGTPLSTGVRQAASEMPAARLGQVFTSQRRRFIASVQPILGPLFDPVAGDLQARLFLQQSIRRNVDYVTNIPIDLRRRMVQDITRLSEEGIFFEQIQLNRELRKTHGFGRYRARLIARDQVGKLYGGLNERRQLAAGIEDYVWQTRQDERVRPSHVANNGKRFSWRSPPPTGHPGTAVQCRCLAVPIVETRRM